jgi:hypothetical protein
MRKLLSVIVLGLLAVACGTKQSASPLDVLPETGVLQMAISDPASIVANIDGYIATGVPIAGPNLVMSQILAATDAENVDSLASWLGIDVHGTVALYMVGVNPQTIGLAATVSNPEAFWTRTTEWGAEWTDAEPIGTAVVKTLTTGQMTANIAIYRGCILAAASRAELTTMIDRIEGRAPRATVTVQPGSIWLKADVTTFGPMVAGQLAMYRPQILSEIEYSGAGQFGGQEMTASLLNLYFDFFDKLLRETKSVEYNVTFGPVDIDAQSNVEFVAGSDLASYMPGEIVDYTGMLPASGVAIAGRLSLPPELSRDAMAAVFTAMGSSPGQEFIDLSAEMCSNTAYAMYTDLPMHMVAVYELPDGAGLDQVRAWIEGSLAFSQAFLGQMPGMTVSGAADSVVDGTTYITYSMLIDPAAMSSESLPQTVMPPMAFTAWLTVTDEIILLEMAPQPILAPSILAGTIEGGTVAEMDYFASAGTEMDAVFAFEMGGYMQMIMAWVGESIPGMESLGESTAWVYSKADFTETTMQGYCSFSGVDLAKFIGTMVASAGAFAQ